MEFTITDARIRTYTHTYLRTLRCGAIVSKLVRAGTITTDY